MLVQNNTIFIIIPTERNARIKNNKYYYYS